MHLVFLHSPIPKLCLFLKSKIEILEEREMGKYMDAPHHHHHHHHHHQPPSLGVRTRAKTKTLALQRLQNPKSKSKPTPCSSNSSSSSSKSSSCYLQLRSRRLEKCFASKTRNPNRRTYPSPVSSSKEVEVSLGEKAVEIEGKSGRNSRETTPCSLIRRDAEISETPGSTNRPASTTASNMRIQTAIRRNFPTSSEMEEFFAVPEKQQQKAFREKYNFDPANDCPLPGRYEWVKLQN